MTVMQGARACYLAGLRNIARPCSFGSEGSGFEALYGLGIFIVLGCRGLDSKSRQRVVKPLQGVKLRLTGFRGQAT